ncbi:MAG: hypothetical protein WC527_09160, partial [Candidatus Margulisiibacteriota bacterium]
PFLSRFELLFHEKIFAAYYRVVVGGFFLGGGKKKPPEVWARWNSCPPQLPPFSERRRVPLHSQNN